MNILIYFETGDLLGIDENPDSGENRAELQAERIALIFAMRGSLSVRLQIHLFNRMVQFKRQQLSHLCAEKAKLVREYNREITLAALKKMDMFRNFTTMETKGLSDKLDEFERTFSIILP